MNFFVENIYTVILVPFWISLIFLFGRIFAVLNSKKVVNAISTAASVYCLIFAAISFIKTVLEKGYIFEEELNFIKIYDFNFNVGVYFDGVSAWLLFLAAAVSLLIIIYSFSYMKNDKGYIRYHGLIQFFNFAMFGLILSQNMFQMYIFWELVGLSSYLLIGFWYKDITVSVSAKRAFLINRVGDFALLAGIILFSGIIHSTLNNTTSVSLPFSEIPYISAQIFGCTSDLMFFTVCILLICGAIAKSAQFPLHTWLIDAMKGPTPVSALIHSATMIVAGVFLLVRLYPLFSLSDGILNFISIIGVTTAVICSIAALCQYNAKKILAYSTSAQLGLMFLALGCCSTTVALFHLTSHAIAKAMLFLSVGTVMYALNSDKWEIAGGLRKKMPVCAYTFLIGIISISGLFFAGFSSKEMILSGLVESNHYVYAVLFLFISFLTVYYLFRLYFHLFEGDINSSEELLPIPKSMVIVPSIFAVFVALIWCVLPKSGNILLIIINGIIALIAVLLVYFVHTKKIIKKIPLLYDISHNAFYFENIIEYVSKLFRDFCGFIVNVEKYIFDGILYVITLICRLAALLFSKMQNGSVQTYLAYSLFVVMMGFAGIMLIYSLIIYLSEVQ